MATPRRARPRPDDGLEAPWDEAFHPDGAVRAHYTGVSEDMGLATAREAAAAAGRRAGLSLGTGPERRLLPVDPVPRILTPREWMDLEVGLVQRARLLEALAADVYGRRLCVSSEAVPERLLDSSRQRTSTPEPSRTRCRRPPRTRRSATRSTGMPRIRPSASSSQRTALSRPSPRIAAAGWSAHGAATPQDGDFRCATRLAPAQVLLEAGRLLDGADQVAPAGSRAS